MKPEELENGMLLREKGRPHSLYFILRQFRRDVGGECWCWSKLSDKSTTTLTGYKSKEHLAKHTNFCDPEHYEVICNLYDLGNYIVKALDTKEEKSK